jgi:hypothetical protein
MAAPSLKMHTRVGERSTRIWVMEPTEEDGDARRCWLSTALHKISSTILYSAGTHCTSRARMRFGRDSSTHWISVASEALPM